MSILLATLVVAGTVHRPATLVPDANTATRVACVLLETRYGKPRVMKNSPSWPRRAATSGA